MACTRSTTVWFWNSLVFKILNLFWFKTLIFIIKIIAWIINFIPLNKYYNKNYGCINRRIDVSSKPSLTFEHPLDSFHIDHDHLDPGWLLDGWDWFSQNIKQFWSAAQEQYCYCSKLNYILRRWLRLYKGMWRRHLWLGTLLWHGLFHAWLFRLDLLLEFVCHYGTDCNWTNSWEN